MTRDVCRYCGIYHASHTLSGAMIVHRPAKGEHPEPRPEFHSAKHKKLYMEIFRGDRPQRTHPDILGIGATA